MVAFPVLDSDRLQERLVSGGIHGHPKGTRSGAAAAMQAIEATMEGIDLKEYAVDHKELQQALEKWGYFKPR